MLKVWKQKWVKRSIKVVEEVEANIGTEVEVGAKVEVKVLVAAEAGVDIIITKRSQNEVIHLPIKNEQRNRRLAAQIIHGRRSGDDPEAKILAQKN